MATNPPKGDGHRNGAVKDRTQFQNPVNKIFYKRAADTGRIMDGKAHGTKFIRCHPREERPDDCAI